VRVAFRWNGRAIVAVLLLCVGTLLSLTMHNGQPAGDVQPPSPRVLDAPMLTITLTRGQLILSGTTQSARHEASLEALVADRFRDHEVQTDFSAGVLLPENWEPLSMRLLYALAAMESANAEIGAHVVSLRGVTADAETLEQRLTFVREAMSADTELLRDVIVVDNESTLDELCRRAFAGLNTLPVEFLQSSAEFRTASFPSLDKVVDFAYDCRHSTIAITGHSDASGNEAWNRQLSQARAQAVADYLVRNGVAPERLIVEGRGSSVPVAGNDTVYGRSRNRRIEFDLRPPLL